VAVESAGFDRLVRRARAHDPAALRELVDAYSPRVFGLLYRLTGSRETAEELLQETFLRLVRMIGEYEHTGKFEPWLFRIAANLARDHARRARRRRGSLALDSFPGADGPGMADVADASQPEPSREAARNEAAARLNECLQRLGEIDREIILLRHFSELSFREIAEILQIPLGTALARAHRALKRLRAEFGQEM
jgi:RNA polymerase sigma-70 factor (ECF subfamily)